MNPIEQAREQVLVVRCQLGDQASLEELFRRHHRPLDYYLRRLLERPDVVADASQETWLAVIRNIGRLRDPERFLPWLYRIARSKALNRMSDRRWASLDTEDPPGEPVSEDEQVFTPADAARIHQGLHQLRPAHREVLVLRFMESLSYEQIAEVTGCHLGTVRSRLHQARQELRTILEIMP